MSIFPIIATVVAVIFAVLLLKQWLRRKRIYQLVWFISLVMFAVSAGFEMISEFVGWNVEVYRIYLVLSASLVAIMGAGALYLILQKNVFSTRGLLAIDVILLGIMIFFGWTMTLSLITDYSAMVFGAMEYTVAGAGVYAILIAIAFLIGRDWDDKRRKILHGHIYLAFVIVLTLWMGVYSAVATVTPENFVAGIAVAGDAMAQHVRNFSPLLTVTGSFLLIGVALFSFLKTKFRFNLWIALGGLTLAIAGSIAREGPEFGNILYLGEVVGVLMLYKGFVDSDKIIKARKEATSSQDPETLEEVEL
ncbi:MAG: hypothetical protein ACTSWA_04450 [Candidatus Thorarchaeota archaeon]